MIFFFSFFSLFFLLSFLFFFSTPKKEERISLKIYATYADILILHSRRLNLIEDLTQNLHTLTLESERGIDVFDVKDVSSCWPVLEPMLWLKPSSRLAWTFGLLTGGIWGLVGSSTILSSWNISPGMVSGEEAGTMLAGASSCPKLSLLRKTIESFSELSAYLSTLETGVPSRLGRDPEFHILVTISYMWIHQFIIVYAI